MLAALHTPPVCETCWAVFKASKLACFFPSYAYTLVILILLMLMMHAELLMLMQEMVSPGGTFRSPGCKKQAGPGGHQATFSWLGSGKNTIHGMLQERFSPQTDSLSETFTT